MQPQNGTGQDHRSLEDRLDAFEDGVSKLIDRIISKPGGEPARSELRPSSTGELVVAVFADPSYRGRLRTLDA